MYQNIRKGIAHRAKQQTLDSNSNSNSPEVFYTPSPYITHPFSSLHQHHIQQHESNQHASHSSSNSMAASFAAAAAAAITAGFSPSSILPGYHPSHPHAHHHLSAHHDLFLHHMQRASAVVASHVAAHRRRKARTVFSDSQLHGLEKR